MNEQRDTNDVTHLLRIAALLWLGYLLALVIIDRLFYPHPLFPPRYYLINGFNALIVLGMVLWRGPQKRLGPLFLPVIIGLISILPLILNQPALYHLPPHIQIRPETITLRLMPITLIALVLTAWQYRGRHVVFFSVGIALFNLGVHTLLFRPGRTDFWPPVVVLVIQLVSFLIVGYFISALMHRLREQQRSLEAAHRQVLHYASTLEHLTISRERNRMARELHDTLAHTLSALSVHLETVKAYWDVEPATAQGMLDQALTTTRSGLQETRRALKSLRASPLDDLGLLLALRQLAEETAACASSRLELALPEHLPALSPDVEQCLYRVAQEALANIAHHANARTLALRLEAEGDTLALTVRDDGIGFDARAAQPEGHFGLAGMRERARLAGGELAIESHPGEETTIHLTIEV